MIAPRAAHLRSVLLIPHALVFMSNAATADSSAPPSGKRVIFGAVHTGRERRFVLRQLVMHFKDENESSWNDAVAKGQIKIAEADLNDDGILERFVMINISDWCGSAGCQGLILQQRGNTWELISEATFSDEETIVMNEKRFGYHKLYTSKSIYTFKNGSVHDIIDLAP